MDVIITLALVFMVWMCIDCIQRKEHFIWIVIMVVLFPVGAVAYYFAVKMKASGPRPTIFESTRSAKQELETEETLQLKEMIGKFHKAYHYEKLGHTYLEQKRYELAISQFREAIQKDSEANDARYGLAKALHGMEQYAESAEVLEELIKIDRKFDYGNAIFGLAECYRMAGLEDKALETYREVIKSFHFFKAYYHYANLLDKRGKKREAIDHMKSIIGSSKDLPEYKLEKERYWIDEAYKFLRKNGVELA
ncbi:MAG: tetratricopeptide repeat protein [Nitrospinaceae bacterium]|nr:tetratricopeptide repeat protein [Nitrospinaceae bacterium]